MTNPIQTIAPEPKESRVKNESLDMNCPGCNTELTTSNVGGYRDYCEKCVDILEKSPFPKSGSAQPAGKYPNLHWIDASNNRLRVEV